MMNPLSLLLVLLIFVPLQAQAQTAGAACATAGQLHESGTKSLVCDSGVWKPVIDFYGSSGIGFQVGYDSGACTSVKTGRIRYSSGNWEYCNSSTWQIFNVVAVGSCNIHGQSVGYVCPDGSVFAGFAPYTSSYQPIFATRCDAGRTWNGSSCTGTRLNMPWNNGNSSGLVVTTATNVFDGRANTATLVATDSNSAAGGVQPHQAAAYCDGLSIHGKTDWYLPSIAEMTQIVGFGSSIGDFVSYPNTYWTSFEQTDGSAAFGNPVTVEIGNNTKDNATNAPVRCIRR